LINANQKLHSRGGMHSLSRSTSSSQQAITPRTLSSAKPILPPPQSNNNAKSGFTSVQTSRNFDHPYQNQYSEVGQTLDDFDFLEDTTHDDIPNTGEENLDSDGILIMGLKELFN
jgi:hypothetical protein